MTGIRNVNVRYCRACSAGCVFALDNGKTLGYDLNAFLKVCEFEVTDEKHINSKSDALPTRPDSEARAKVMYELCEATYQQTDRTFRDIEDKSRSLLQLVSIIVGGGLITLMKVLFDSRIFLDNAGKSEKTALIILFIIAFGFSVIAFILSLNVLKVKRFVGRPDPEPLLRDFKNASLTTIYEEAAKYFSDAELNNRKQLSAVVWYLKLGYISTGIAFISFFFLFFSIIIYQLI